MSEWTKERHEAAKVGRTKGRNLRPEEQDDALAEIERGWAEIERLTAPVDVEAEVKRLVDGIKSEPPPAALRTWIGPIVEDQARIARELAGCEATASDLAEQLIAARAEIARLTAAPGEAWERLSALRAAGWAVAVHNDYRLNGKPHTFWLFTRDGREVHGEGRTDADALTACAAFAAVEPRLDAIAADPSAPVDPAEQAYQPTVEMRLEYTATASTAQPVTVDVAAITHDFRPDAQDGMPRLAGVEPVDHAATWRGMAAEIASPLTPEAREIIASAPGDEVTDAELADAIERTSGEGLLAWPGGILRRLALAEQARRAAPTMTAERAREVVVLLEACMAEPPAAGLAMVQRAFRINGRMTKAIAMLRAMSAEPTPPRALTEAEAEARGRLAKTLAKAAEWHGERAGYGGAGQDWHARCQTACADAAAILAASRGDVPPEVRPSGCNRHTDCAAADRSFVAANGRSPTRAFHSHDPDDDYPAPEMAVTTGDAEQWTPKPGVRTITDPFVVQPERRAAPDEIVRTCGERDYVVRHDDGTEAHYDADELGPEPAAVATGEAEGVPSIAGPAGLDLASGRPAGFWNAGRPVERRGEEPPARPRVGAWIAWEPACGASIYDDHGQVVASAWETPDGWRWFANRAHLAPVQCSAPVSREEAEGAAVIVLSSWADVSAAGGES